jgi:subtilisin family serine protease
VKKLRFALFGAVVAALVGASSAAAFTPTNQYYGKQWYLGMDNAFDAWDAPPPDLAPVKVAIVDSGVDCSLPDFDTQIAKVKSFVGGSACMDAQGTARSSPERSPALWTRRVVGLAYSSRLLVAKVVANDGIDPLKAEAAGIRWAVNQNAKVVNLQLRAVRDPQGGVSTRTPRSRPRPSPTP